jgi:hypothetical protein
MVAAQEEREDKKDVSGQTYCGWVVVGPTGWVSVVFITAMGASGTRGVWGSEMYAKRVSSYGDGIGEERLALVPPRHGCARPDVCKESARVEDEKWT